MTSKAVARVVAKLKLHLAVTHTQVLETDLTPHLLFLIPGVRSSHWMPTAIIMRIRCLIFAFWYVVYESLWHHWVFLIFYYTVPEHANWAVRKVRKNLSFLILSLEARQRNRNRQTKRPPDLIGQVVVLHGDKINTSWLSIQKYLALSMCWYTLKNRLIILVFVSLTSVHLSPLIKE